MLMEKEQSTKEICEEQYHAKQFDNPYRSTIAFAEWLGKYVDLNEGKTNIRRINASMVFHLCQQINIVC